MPVRSAARIRLPLLILIVALVANVAPALAQDFVHPGILVTADEINHARNRVAKAEEPWTSALSWMRSHYHAQPDFTASPVANVYQGSYGEGDVGGWAIMIDARAAYLHALLWAMTDDVAYAEKSAAIIRAWASTLVSIDGINAKLIGAAAFSGFANAGELLAHTGFDWDPADRAALETMFRDICYPLIQDFQPGYNGNWDAIITNGMMAMGVFLDDRAMFDRAVNYFKFGEGNGSLPNYVYPDGTTQETYRDAEHENMGITGLTGSAQIARHQGIDLFGYLDNRLLAGAEGVADRVIAAGISAGPGWEMLYAHYHQRLGLPMPNVERLFSTEWISARPEDYGLMQGVGYGTLTAYELAVPNVRKSVGTLKRHFRHQ